MNPENTSPEQPLPDSINPGNISPPPSSVIAPTSSASQDSSSSPVLPPSPQPTPTLPAFMTQSPQPVPSSVDLLAGRKPPRNWKKLALIPAALLSLSVVAAAAWFLFLKPDNPETLFRKSLESALSTKSLQVDTEDNLSSYKMKSITKADVNNVKDPKVSSVYTEDYGQGESKFESYATLQNGFVKITGADAAVTSGLEGAEGKWIQYKQDGKGDDTSGYGFLTYSLDPAASIFGYLVHGNFPEDERSEFVDFLIENDVYEYNPTKVKDRTIDGKKFLVYDIDLNESKLREFGRIVAKSLGLAEDAFSNTVIAYSSDVKMKFFIDPSQKRTIKLEVDADGLLTEITYSGFDKTAVAAEPEAEVSYEEYTKLAEQPFNDLDGGGDESGGDTERKTDINALHGQIEAYYAQNGAYPALAEINNPSWRAENMKGLDSAALQDPAGTVQKLAASASDFQYGYAVFQFDGTSPCTTDAFDCAIYTLTANLDEGGTYVKDSLN